jgi:hypothetical protein
MPSNDLPFYLIRNTVYDINELLSGFDLADSTSLRVRGTLKSMHILWPLEERLPKTASKP